MARLSSVEPLSTTISSKSGSLCAQMDSIESRSHPAPFKLGMITLAFMPGPPLQQQPRQRQRPQAVQKRREQRQQRLGGERDGQREHHGRKDRQPEQKRLRQFLAVGAVGAAAGPRQQHNEPDARDAEQKQRAQ